VSEPVQPPDPDRRLFFRQFAKDAATSVGSVLGAAQSLQESTAEAARELLGGPPPGDDAEELPAPLVDADGAPLALDASTAGWRAPFRWDGDVVRVVDQRRLPDVLVDLELRSAAESVRAINDGAVVGAAVQAQVAAVTLVIVATRTVASRAFARRATIRGAANAFRLARPGSAPMAAVLDRMLALVEEAGLDTSGDELAARLHAEATLIIGETVDDHGALVGHLVGVLPGTDEEPLRVLAMGSTGAMGGGQFGTALSAVQTVHHTGRRVRVLLPEGRPGFEGARIAAWELRQAGVPYAVLTDAAAAGRIAAHEVDVVLVAADRVAMNGDVIAPTGAYPLALAAAFSGVPFIVCAATNAIDGTLADGAAATLEDGRPTPVLRAGLTRMAPEGSDVRNPLQDLVPARLVAAIATEEGVLRPPYAPGIAAAVEAASGHRASAPGYAALLARREAANTPAAGSADAVEAGA
jgi:methylthioribose-1-phosphate isomerase